MSTDAPTSDEVWAMLTHLVMDTRDQWKRAISERTGLQFSRVRVLKRLRSGPLTMSQLADAAMMDKPATTVVVNDLVDRGLVVREISPENRRCKLVTITERGRAALTDAYATPDPAPPALAALAPGDLSALRDLLRKIER
ncbi:MarR family winged helix-turn-helix transcriptional regulator [Nocardia arthritidis]|uniref:MarR family transcriptional regulator n=1 Tax=Nocardia arthritidis TaxID=228602 RepID=A0A6G9YF08_9NOCA|nr:MarR family transcriptional regulator [Nocardia arthritidis]QIS11809.1 MarR family transcriptional regulator [Nocardia arthritidis]